MLFHHRAAEVGARAVLAHAFGQRDRRDRPADPQPGRERLAHRAHQDDPIRLDALQAADGVAVVAELGVVVVLDHEPSGRAGPADEGRPAGRREHDPGRVLMGRGDQDGLGRRRGEGRDVDAARVHGDGQELEPGAAQQRQLPDAGRVLDGEHAVAVLGQQPEQDREAVRDPVGHDDLVRRGVGRPDPAEIAGQLEPQRGHPARVRVRQVAVRDRAQHVAGRGQPAVARERGEVGYPWPQVVRQLGVRLRPGRPGTRRRAVRGGQRRHPGALAAVRDEEAFGDQLLVRRDDDAAGHDELLREITAGGQSGAGDQSPGADRRAQFGGDLIRKPPSRTVEVEMEVGHGSVVRSAPMPPLGGELTSN